MRRFMLGRGLWASAFVLCALVAAAYADGETPTIRIPRVTRAPTLEDFLNGVPREAEAVVTQFIQFDPKDGDPVSQPTAAYLSYDDRNLYVGWICKDDPSQIRAHMVKRDNLLGEDRVSVAIDTFHDHRRNYWFDVNPYGIQMDGTTTDAQDDFSFDTVWYSEARLTADGYVVLQTIPFKSLRFPKKPLQDWAIQLGRMIQRNVEMSCWPHITRRLLPGWTAQFGHAEGIESISPGRNIQFIPYGIVSRARYLETEGDQAPRFVSDTDPRLGVDAKMVLRDALALDMTVNPDFSQVESDQPQVTINQRYEVYFPEKRPFFIENAPMFQTPETLFFSRRIADPQFGVRLSGKFGGWALGALVADDRAPGRTLDESDLGAGKRALIEVVRLQREIGRESRLGMLVTSRDFAGASNRVFAADSRIRLTPNWTWTSQIMGSDTHTSDGRRMSGPAFTTAISHSGEHFSAQSLFRQLSPDFRADLGFIPRIDIREWHNEGGYTWRPEKGPLLNFGSDAGADVIWDTKGRLQDWEVGPEIFVEFKRNTRFAIERAASYELFDGIEFRKNMTSLTFNCEYLGWLGFHVWSNHGAAVNYYPNFGVKPFLADLTDSSTEIIFRPTSQLIIDSAYIYNRLHTRRDSGPGWGLAPAAIFTNHIARTKINYQFTRELSLRAILDYSAVLPNQSLVSLEKTKKLGADLLLTYLVNPWTALHVGYTDLRENLRLDPTQSPKLSRTHGLDTPVGRQFFIKFSYLLRM
jgi:hypothetical protein